MKKNFERLFDSRILIGFCPDFVVPDPLKDLFSSAVNLFVQKGINFVGSKWLNGVECIVNLLLEILKGNINHEQCLKYYENRPNNDSDESLKFDNFKLMYEGHYNEQEVNLQKEMVKLVPDTTLYYMKLLKDNLQIKKEN